jgi:hypothetical protein
MLNKDQYARPTLIRWGPVLAGAVVGLALMVLLSSLWVALAQGSGIDAIDRNLHWFGFGTAVFALLLAGLLAGWLSGVRGAGAGLFHGLTVWGLILVGTIVVTVPQAFQLFQAFTSPLPELGAGPLWATFLSLLIGLVAAAAGGMIGGGISRPGWLYAPMAGDLEDQTGAHRRGAELGSGIDGTRDGERREHARSVRS